MSAAREHTMSKKIDRAFSSIMQRNLCVICHLPLFYGSLDHEWITVQYYWKLMLHKVGTDSSQDTEANNVTDTEFHIDSLRSRSPSYGTWYTECNAEKCHLINSCLTLEITPLNVFFSPLRQISFNSSFYYKHPSGPIRLIGFTQQEIFQMSFNIHGEIKQKALLRLNDNFNTRGVLYFMACKDCNSAHTGEAAVRHLFLENYGLRTNSAKYCLPVIMYTLLFDSLCDERRYITFDDDDAFLTHKFRVWLHYAMLMFLAQQKQLTTRSNIGPKYFAKNAHRDIGLCDFYMGQILGAILYANFEIRYDFTFLYQTCLCFLAYWAKQNQVYICTHEQRSLWRWVLSNSNDVLMSPRTDTNDTRFWAWDGNFANIVRNRILNFTSTWIPAIGRAIQHERNAPPGCNNALYQSLRTFVIERTCIKFYVTLRTLAATRDENITLTNWFMEQPSIFRLRKVLKTIHPQKYKQLLWENYTTLSWHRTLHWCDTIYARHVTAEWADFKFAVATLLNAE